MNGIIARAAVSLNPNPVITGIADQKRERLSGTKVIVPIILFARPGI
jgi:hypothetical protein